MTKSAAARKIMSQSTATPVSTPAAPTKPPAAKAAALVTVACKIPNGVILQLCTPDTYVEETPSGSRERKRWVKGGPAYFVRGPAQPNGPVPKGYVRPSVAGGFALTSNIPGDFWRTWVEQNHLNPIVVNNMIWSETDRASTAAWARENGKRLSGLEPLDPDGDDRMPKPIVPSIGKVETADEMADRAGLPETADDEV